MLRELIGRIPGDITQEIWKTQVMDVTMDPMFAAAASKRQAANEHGQKPQDTAAGKASRASKKPGRKASRKAYHFLPRGLLKPCKLFTPESLSQESCNAPGAVAEKAV